MALTAQALLEPISDETPAGEDLAYDPQRYELEQLFEVSAPALPGEEAAADDTDWRRVLQLIEAQFLRTKDVWLAVYLCRAGARSGQLKTVEIGAEVLAGLFELYWDSAHPTLEELGTPGRKAPCDSLANRAAFLLPLEKVILLEHPRFGRFSGADFERFRVDGAGATGYGAFRAALDDLGELPLSESVGRLGQIEAHLRSADTIFTGNAGAGEAPNFAPVYETIKRLQRAASAFLTSSESTIEETGSRDPDAKLVGGPRTEAGLSGSVDSRADVVRALDAVMDYYRRREPGSAVPLLLERAKAWIPLDFMSILKDVAPDGVDQAALVLKFRAADDEDEDS